VEISERYLPQDSSLIPNALNGASAANENDVQNTMFNTTMYRTNHFKSPLADLNSALALPYFLAQYYTEYAKRQPGIK
jgi:hypothetical protein